MKYKILFIYKYCIGLTVTVIIHLKLFSVRLNIKTIKLYKFQIGIGFSVDFYFYYNSEVLYWFCRRPSRVHEQLNKR